MEYTKRQPDCNAAHERCHEIVGFKVHLKGWIELEMREEHIARKITEHKMKKVFMEPLFYQDIKLKNDKHV